MTCHESKISFFEHVSFIYNMKDSSDGGGKASPILEKLEIYGDGPPDSVVQFPRRSVPYYASMLIEAFLHVQFVSLTPK